MATVNCSMTESRGRGTVWSLFSKGRRIAVLASLVLLTGCLTVDLSDRPPFPGLEATRSDQALLYVYRPSATIGGALSPVIEAEDRVIGQLPSGSYFSVYLAPGTYHIEATLPSLITSAEDKAFDLTVEAGETYFIAKQESRQPYEDGRTLGVVSDGRYRGVRYYFRYALVPEDEALRALEWCRLAPPTDS